MRHIDGLYLKLIFRRYRYKLESISYGGYNLNYQLDSIRKLHSEWIFTEVVYLDSGP